MKPFHLNNLRWLRRSPRVILLTSLILGFCPQTARSQTDPQVTLQLFNTAGASYQQPNNPNPLNIRSNTIEVGATVVTVDVDLGITITQITDDLIPGQTGTFEITVVNNGPETVDRFLIDNNLTDILENIALGKVTLVVDGVPVDPTTIQVSIQPDGSYLVTGLTFKPGSIFTLEVTGTVKNVTPDQLENGQFFARVEVKSPLFNGVPFFNDINPDNNVDQLVDPLGRLLDCEGKPLENYSGFIAALYNSDDMGTQGSLLQLPPLDPNNQPKVPVGISNVNPINENPFDLGNTNQYNDERKGQFNFFFSRALGQASTPGQTYLLVIQPPAGSDFDTRRMLIKVISVSAESFSYRAIPLDGLPIGLADRFAVAQEVTVSQAESEVVLFKTPETFICQSQALNIRKTADRATVEPGGFVVYQVVVTNTSSSVIDNAAVIDRLPVGFRLLEDSVQAVIGNQPVPVTTEINGREITFRLQQGLPVVTNPDSNEISARIVYAVEVLPDAIRGDGRNFALASGDRQDNKIPVSDGPAIYQVDITEGLFSDLGTIIGRVFVDKNFDGEQQYGEPGVPNAVVFMQNGNRIVTDQDGLFSVGNVLPGWHTGVLDLTSVPGYTLAPNPYILKKESQSQAVRLEGGGTARMNFAVTPVVEERR